MMWATLKSLWKQARRVAGSPRWHRPGHIPSAECLAASQRRWRGDETPAGLTWGVLMTGSSLWDCYCRSHRFTSSDRILEIGPGYGRVLETAINRQIPFAEFVAIDLSEARICRLRERYPSERVRFEVGDAMVWRDGGLFNVAISSATFEHLYPDFRKTLNNLREQLRHGGQVMIDFIKSGTASAAFEPDTGAYVRAYTLDELRQVFTDSGFRIDTIEHCTLGVGAHGLPVERFLVVASPAICVSDT
jgi:phospholipid N-methyltransferase